MRIEIEHAVATSGGPWGEIADLVLEPVSHVVSHLVVQPPHRHDLARLVSVDRVSSVDDEVVLLDCDAAELHRTTPLADTAYLRLGELPPVADGWAVGVTSVLPPAFSRSVGAGAALAVALAASDAADGSTAVATAFDRIPVGRVELRRASEVCLTDGHVVGRLDAVDVDETFTVERLIVHQAHLLRRRHVAVPVGVVETFETDRVDLAIGREQFRAFGSMPSPHRHTQGT